MAYFYDEFDNRLKVNGVIYNCIAVVKHWEDAAREGVDAVYVHEDIHHKYFIRMTYKIVDRGYDCSVCKKLEQYSTREDAEEPRPESITVLPNPETMDFDGFEIDTDDEEDPSNTDNMEDPQ